ncbi:hypothetical protein BA903_29670 [Klebsiella pneumoniae]|nr:hypothetical protein BA903_29670 [Klebsiella pneumoniae]
MTPVFLLYNPQTASDNLFFVFGGPARLFVKTVQDIYRLCKTGQINYPICTGKVAQADFFNPPPQLRHCFPVRSL